MERQHTHHHHQSAFTMAKYIIFLFVMLHSFIGSVHGDFFPTPQFSGEDVTQKMFGSQTSELFPIAYGDFNSDKLTDIIAVPSDRSAIMLYLAHEEAPFLRLKKKCYVQTEHNMEKLEIVGASPGDFTGDGLMDLLVTMRQEGRKSLEIVIFEGNSSELICENRMDETISMAREPLVVDLNGDMIMDLVSEEYISEDHNNHTTKKAIWIFTQEAKLKPDNFSFEVLPGFDKKLQDIWESRPMSNPPSNAFVDVDGDSIPELVILTMEGEFHQVQAFYIHTYKVIVTLSEKNVKFKYTGVPVKLNGTEQINVVGQPLFVDFNRDGRLMQLLPFCSTLTCNNKEGIAVDKQGIKVIYNRTVTDLLLSSVSFDNIEWGFDRPVDSVEKALLRKDRYYSRSLVLRVGDYNLDGFPDLIAVLEASGSGQRGHEIIKRAVVFENVPCTDPKCPFPRKFNPNFKLLWQYTNVTLATFFDIHEDGLIDVLIVRRNNASTPTKPGRFEFRAFQNSPDYDSNFIKVMVLTGRKCEKCPKRIPYGNLLTGPIISYKTKTQEGALQTALAAQNYRSAIMPMDLPYTIFGIGHSPNFVETLRIDISSHSHEWTQIIPNSQIIVIPHPVDEPKQWKAKLFLTPSDAVLQTFAVLLAICLVVTCIVVSCS